MSIQQKIQELEQLKRDVPKQAKLIASKFKEQILDYVRVEQLFKRGIDGNGNLLKEYTNFTKSIKIGKGQPIDRTTLLDTGQFFAFFDLKFEDEKLDIFSTDSKSIKLIEKYGDSIFDLTIKNNEIVNKDIFEENLIKWILNTKTFTQI
ncbi:hypothetical protein [Tenacibaculum phage JQ]|nr:hypothetical protein [Tenacibaculum phage JQ]